jgi:radical SAM superfamily enzyme YgiQ (UPF0313 family)
MKKVLLINPKTINKYYHIATSLTDRSISRLIAWLYDGRFQVPAYSHCSIVPPITLYALKALIGDRCEVIILDEQVEEIPSDLSCDLVCITSTTPQIHRAMEISADFLRRGIPSVIGGIHATCLPEECQRHFTSVCTGEAEAYMDELLEDFHRGSLKPRYTQEKPIPMEDTPFYHYDMGTGKYMPFHVISFSRGCPFRCDFCSVQSTLGNYRTRPVESVAAEIERIGSRTILFPDATLTGDLKKAMKLFQALKPLKVQWFGQITLNTCRDQEFLDLMAESGCWLVSVGLESLNGNNIKASSKNQNHVEEYVKIIRDLHDRNIAIEGNLVFGFDEDTLDTFDHTANFVVEMGIDLPEFYVLTPYPGTNLYERLQAEGRIVDRNWAHYDNTHFHYLPVFEPRNMSRSELRAGCRHAEQIVYSYRNTLRRIWNSGVYKTPALLGNYIYAKRTMKRQSLFPLGEPIDEEPGWEVHPNIPGDPDTQALGVGCGQTTESWICP